MVTRDDVEKKLWVGSKVDLLIRTGESRLSGFLLYQCSESTKFLLLRQVLWPEFTVLHLSWVLFQYRFVL